MREDSREMWAPTQQLDRATRSRRSRGCHARCRLNVTFLGGGFGRKWELDFIRQTAQVALGVRGRPVKLTWTREQDFRHDRYRPAHIVRTRVGLASDGRILGMHSRTTGVSMWKYQGRALAAGMGDPFATGLLTIHRPLVKTAPGRCRSTCRDAAPIPVLRPGARGGHRR
ncbi:MAG: molybdopterin cofactor-binding domain-containing protein [Steroidobacteraceae bacterium]